MQEEIFIYSTLWKQICIYTKNFRCFGNRQYRMLSIFYGDAILEWGGVLVAILVSAVMTYCICPEAFLANEFHRSAAMLLFPKWHSLQRSITKTNP